MLKYMMFFVALFFGIWMYFTAQSFPEYAKCRQGDVCDVYVDRVIDGDTFQTSSGMRIRLANYNAPELNTPIGNSAWVCLIGHIQGKTVKVRFGGRDAYGRQLGTVVSHRVTC